MKIGKLTLKNRFIAAPMAGFSDASWRLIVTELGAGLTYSEMASTEGLIRALKKTKKYLLTLKGGSPFGIQLFGANPESYAKTIDILKNFEFDVIDVNMGCPVKKVISKGAGAALMRTPKLAGEIITAVRRKYIGPLTVKIRAGWSEKEKNAVEMARTLESAGADAIIIHPRTKTQGFTGHADWELIKLLKSEIKLPVIGNGDINTPEGAQKMFDETNCDAIMIGRAALSNPFIFRILSGGSPPSTKEKFAVIKRHISLLAENEDGKYTLTMLKKFLPKYLKGMRGHKTLLTTLYAGKNLKQILDGLDSFEHGHDNGD